MTNKSIFALCLLLISMNVWSKNFLIYSVAQDLPMGDSKPIKKNYYVNIGEQQGVKEGTELSVYRLLNRTNPYAVDKSVSFRIKVGELKVIHVEGENSIAELSQLNGNPKIYMEIPSLNIGDQIDVKTQD